MGLVPTFLHDGITIIESKDIILYLDQTFPEPPLGPKNASDEAAMLSWLDAADDAQPDLKLLSHEFLFRVRKPMNQAEIDSFAASHHNQALINFVREWASCDQLPREKINSAVNRTDNIFKRFDEHIEGRNWIIGDVITLADVAWIPNVHRMWLMD